MGDLIKIWKLRRTGPFDLINRGLFIKKADKTVWIPPLFEILVRFFCQIKFRPASPLCIGRKRRLPAHCEREIWVKLNFMFGGRSMAWNKSCRSLTIL